MVDSVNGHAELFGRLCRRASRRRHAACRSCRSAPAPPASTTFSPTIVVCQRAAAHVDQHALAQLHLREIFLVGAVGAFGPGAAVGIVEEHARHGDGQGSSGRQWSAAWTCLHLPPGCSENHHIQRRIASGIVQRMQRFYDASPARQASSPPISAASSAPGKAIGPSRSGSIPPCPEPRW